MTELQKLKLIHAVINNQLNTISRLLAENKYDFELENQSLPIDLTFNNLILIAAEAGQREVIELFLKKNPKLRDRAGKYGQTPLIFAAMFGHADLVQFLISKKAELDHAIHINEKHQDHGKTALHWATEGGHDEVVKQLITAGATISLLNSKHPIHLAAEAGHLKLVKFFLKKNPGLLNITDQHGQTPLLLAASCGHADIVQFLTSEGAELEQATTLVGDPDHGKTAFLWAVEQGFSDIADILMRAGAAITISRGEHPIHIASDAGHLDIVRLLLNIDPGLINLCNTDEETPLICAARCGQADLVQYLILEGADLNGKAIKPTSLNYDYTALHWATLHGHFKVVNILLEAHAAVTLQKGRHPIHIAAAEGHVDIVKLFLQKNPELLNLTDQDGQTPLHWAARNGQDHVTQYLLAQEQINLDATRNTPSTPEYHGFTALDWAAYHQHHDALNIMIQHVLMHSQPTDLKVLDYIKTAEQALEFLVLSPGHANLILNNARIKQRIDQYHATKDSADNDKISYYKFGHKRRSSFFAQINPNTGNATVFKPEHVIGEGLFGLVRSFVNEAKNERIAVKSLKENHLTTTPSTEYEHLELEREAKHLQQADDHKTFHKRNVQSSKNVGWGWKLVQRGMVQKPNLLDQTVNEAKQSNIALNKHFSLWMKRDNDDQYEYSSRLVMQYIDGESAYTHLNKVQSTQKIAKIILHLIISLHSFDQKLVHGDCKLGNALISDEPNNLKTEWIDLGMSHPLFETRDHTNPPNTHYAPECSRSHTVAQTNQDIYSFGYALYKLLCEHPKGDILAETYPAILDFCQKATRKIPRDRPTLESFYEALVSEYQTEEACLKTGFKFKYQ